MNIYYQKKLGINVCAFWKSVLLSSISFVIPIVFGICVMNFYSFHNLFDFCALIIVYTFIYFLSVYFLGFNKEEKDIINRLFRKK